MDPRAIPPPPDLLMLVDGSTDTLIVRVPHDIDRGWLAAQLEALGDKLIGWAHEVAIADPHAVMSFAAYAAETTVPRDLALMHAEHCGAGSRRRLQCTCGLAEAAVRLRELAGVRPQLTEPQARLLMELFDNAGVITVDGRGAALARALAAVGLTELEGSEVRITPLGTAEAAHRAADRATPARGSFTVAEASPA